MSNDKIKVLAFAGGRVHDFKGVGLALKDALGECQEFEVAYVEDNLDALVAQLGPRDVLVLQHTGGNLTDAQRDGLLNWLAAGKAFVGIHSAADSFKTCPQYIEMIGGVFRTHPAYRDYEVAVVDVAHPIMQGLPSRFMVKDEQYILNYDPSKVRVLCEAAYEVKDKTGKVETGVMPTVWTKPWAKGRVVYIALGHNPAACRQDAFKLILRQAVLWAAKPETENG